MGFDSFFNFYDVFYKIVLKTNKGSYTKQGILFRDSNNLGLIIPVFKEFDEGQLNFITIYSNQINDELEFNISSDCGIIYGESLMYIPLDELKINGTQIVHTKNAYQRAHLAKLNYCLKSHFSEDNDNMFFSKNYSIFSYFIIKDYGLIENGQIFFPRVLYFEGEPTVSSGPATYYIISSLDIKQYIGSPCLCILKNQRGETIKISIMGIVVEPSYHLLSSAQNTGILITANGILNFINNF